MGCCRVLFSFKALYNSGSSWVRGRVLLDAKVDQLKRTVWSLRHKRFARTLGSRCESQTQGGRPSPLPQPSGSGRCLLAVPLTSYGSCGAQGSTI